MCQIFIIARTDRATAIAFCRHCRALSVLLPHIPSIQLATMAQSEPCGFGIGVASLPFRRFPLRLMAQCEPCGFGIGIASQPFRRFSLRLMAHYFTHHTLCRLCATCLFIFNTTPCNNNLHYLSYYERSVPHDGSQAARQETLPCLNDAAYRAATPSKRSHRHAMRSRAASSRLKTQAGPGSPGSLSLAWGY